MEDNVHMLLEDTIVEKITRLDPAIYGKYIWYNKRGKPLLYVQFKKALYWTLQAVLQFWKLLLETPHEWGLTLNHMTDASPQNINGKQVHNHMACR